MITLSILFSIIISISPLPPRYDIALQAGKLAQHKWVKIDLKGFSFYAPPELKLQHDKGIDSAVWSYTGKNLKLVVDLGQYSGKPKIYEKEPDYREEQIIIDGKEAVICFYRRTSVAQLDLQYSAAVYFPKVNSRGGKLSFYVVGISPEEQEIAREIFLSIEFN